MVSDRNLVYAFAKTLKLEYLKVGDDLDFAGCAEDFLGEHGRKKFPDTRLVRSILEDCRIEMDNVLWKGLDDIEFFFENGNEKNIWCDVPDYINRFMVF